MRAASSSRIAHRWSGQEAGVSQRPAALTARSTRRAARRSRATPLRSHSRLKTPRCAAAASRGPIAPAPLYARFPIAHLVLRSTRAAPQPPNVPFHNSIYAPVRFSLPTDDPDSITGRLERSAFLLAFSIAFVHSLFCDNIFLHFLLFSPIVQYLLIVLVCLNVLQFRFRATLLQ